MIERACALRNCCGSRDSFPSSKTSGTPETEPGCLPNRISQTKREDRPAEEAEKVRVRRKGLRRNKRLRLTTVDVVSLSRLRELRLGYKDGVDLVNHTIACSNIGFSDFGFVHGDRSAVNLDVEVVL